MMNRNRPLDVMRPFAPNTSAKTDERLVHALEHIAYALSAIDHNIDVLVQRVPDLTKRG